MTRDQAFNLMIEMIQSPNLRKHGLAVEAIMRALCKELRNRFEQGRTLKGPTLDTEFHEEEWAIVGLLHDADYELVEKDPTKHTLVTEEKLRALGMDDERISAPLGNSSLTRIINGIKAHHDGIKDSRDNFLERSVYAADELSGLITACALVRPDKKLASVTVDSVMKKFPQKSFAAGAKREQILACEKELGIPLKEFVRTALNAMQKISGDLGL